MLIRKYDLFNKKNRHSYPMFNEDQWRVSLNCAVARFAHLCLVFFAYMDGDLLLPLVLLSAPVFVFLTV